MTLRPRFGLPFAFAAIAALLLSVVPAFGQETAGGLQGFVTIKSDKSPLPGVSVEAVHVPTGTRYTTVTAANGRFVILNVRVGGPYTVSARIGGFKTEIQKDIEIGLGDLRDLEFTLEVERVQQAVEVSAKEIPFISPDRMGSGSSVPDEEIKALPTVRKQFQDFARNNPYVNVAASDPTGTSISIAGMNNRYNSIQIDGAVNNDLFGLSATGTPGGQTDTQPISLEAIQEIQVVISPYDVKQGGFTGGAINAVTRSGTNDFHGSVYGSERNQNFIGNGPNDKPYANFKNDQYGARLGGPILRDQLFFFASAERNRTGAPTGTSADGSTSVTYQDPAGAAQFRNDMITKYGIDPGAFGDVNTRTNSDLLFGRLDFNASPSNQVTLRHNYVNALEDIGGNRSATQFKFPDDFYTIADSTNSTVLQVNSVFGADSFNAGRLGYQTINDARVVPVQFPTVYIGSATGASTGNFSLVAGTERSSGANSLDQKIFEVTDDYSLVKGNQTITLGTHNEFFRFTNLFIQDIYGTYIFNTLADFEKGIANSYQVQFATPGLNPASQFGAQQWGLYLSDVWRVGNNLTVNLGIRGDLPRLTDRPRYNPLIFSTFGVDSSNVPNNQLILSPRLGFNWSPGGSGKDQVRGGIGIFAGRTPFVWISNEYGNTGIGIVNLSAKNVPFNPDPLSPPTNFPPGTAAITVNGIDPNFKFPRVLRSSLAYDRELPFGIHGTVEATYTKTLQDIFYQDLNKIPTGTTAFDGSPVYKNLNPAFADMIFLTNTTRGEQQDGIVQLEKRFPFGLSFNASYAYMNAKTAFEGTSSVAYSNWQFYTTNGDIYTPQLTRSFFEVKDRFNVVVSQSFRTGPLNHNAAFVFIAQSGQPYSVLMGGDPNKDGTGNNDLIFIPQNYSDIVWKGAGAPSEADWNNFLSSTGLDKYRGQIEPRNALTSPWNRSLDFHYDVELPIKVIRTQLTFDILNLVNLFDSSKGIIQYVPNQTYSALTYSGIDATTGKPIYTVASGALSTTKIYTLQDLRSRWQLKAGARLSF
jgi:hypothetical protein